MPPKSFCSLHFPFSFRFLRFIHGDTVHSFELGYRICCTTRSVIYLFPYQRCQDSFHLFWYYKQCHNKHPYVFLLVHTDRSFSRAVTLKLACASKSPQLLIKTQIAGAGTVFPPPLYRTCQLQASIAKTSRSMPFLS